MAKSEKHDIWQALIEERQFQDVNHGGITTNPHSVIGWIGLIEEEMFEAKKEAVKGSNLVALSEVLQLAATALACLEQHGVVSRWDVI